jgi:hypothetical protein
MAHGVQSFHKEIKGVITSHTVVAPRLKAAAYAKSTPRFAASSLLGLLCSDALYKEMIPLCIQALSLSSASECSSTYEKVCLRRFLLTSSASS